MRNYDEGLLEPAKYYREQLKDKFKNETEKYFDELVKKSGLNIEENRKLIKEYDELYQDSQKLSNAKKSRENIFGLFALCLFIAIGTGLWFYFIDKNQNPINYIIILIVIILSIIGAINFKKKAEIFANLLQQKEENLMQKQREAYKQMYPLNSLFHRETTHFLIRKVIPFINLDYNFNMKRFEQLVTKYNLYETKNEDYSTLDLLSGDILGNPFVFIKELVHSIGTYTYTGQRTVSYTVYTTDSQGKRHSRTVYQTLTASVEKPGPYYNEQTTLVYGNDAAANLTFSRIPHSKKTTLFDIKQKILKIREMTTDGKIQGMSNEEFDATFNAQNRNNEVEFRLLFTPLAQQNFKEIFENSPYGDDFIFRKNRKINEIEAKHMRNWAMDTTPENYIDFSYDRTREKFINYNCEYFEHMFASFMPLLSIPLYQQMKSSEYIYKKRYNYNCNTYLMEMLANLLDINLLKPANAVNVRTMLKTRIREEKNESDIVEITAHSYKTKTHTDYIPRMAGNGRIYSVPVQWEEYIPIQKTTQMEIKKVNTDASENDIIKIANECELNKTKGRKVYKDYYTAQIYTKKR